MIREATPEEAILFGSYNCDGMFDRPGVKLTDGKSIMGFFNNLKQSGHYYIVLNTHADCRGAIARTFIQQCIDTMFEKYDAIELVGDISSKNKHTLLMAKLVDRGATLTQCGNSHIVVYRNKDYKGQ